MPMAIPLIGAAFLAAGSIMTAVGVTATIAGISLATIATVAGVALMAVSMLTMQVPKPTSAGAQLDTKMSAKAPVPVLYGRTATGGTLVYRELSGAKNSKLFMAIALSAAGPIAGVEYAYANDVGLNFFANPSSAISMVTATTPSSKKLYRNKFAQRWLTGETPSPTTISQGFGQYGPAPKAPGKASGHALALVYADYDSDQFPQGLPKMLWTVKGVKVYDPRKDSTYPGGSGSHRLANAATWEFSENPYLCALHWTLGKFENGRKVVGIGAKPSEIDFAAFVRGANVADANNWKCGGVAATSDDKFAVLSTILAAGGGVPIARGAQISCFVNAPLTTTATITASDIVRDIEIQNSSSLRSRYNTVIPTYREPSQFWQMVSGEQVSTDVYVQEDGGFKTSKEVEFSMVQQAAQAHQLATYNLVNSREMLTFTVGLKLAALAHRVGSAILVNVPEVAAGAVKCLVINREYNPTDQVVTLTLKSENDAKHAFALGQSQIAPPTIALTGYDASNIAAPEASAWIVSGAVLESTTGAKAIVRIGGASDNPYTASIVVEYRPVGAIEWYQAGVYARDTTSVEITSVTSGTAYQVAISYRSTTGALSDRTIFGPATAGVESFSWGAVTGPQKPQDGATVGAPGGTLVGGVPAEDIAAGVGSYMQWRDIRPAKVTLAKAGVTSSLDDAQNAKLIVKWTALTGVSDYEVAVSKAGMNEWDYYPAGQAATATIPALANVEYDVRVRAKSSAGVVGDWSDTITHKVAKDKVAPLPPVDIYTEDSYGRYVIGWKNDAAADLVRVDIYSSKTNDPATATLFASETVSPGTTTVAQPPETAVGLTRYFWLKSVDRSGNASPFSARVSATTTKIDKAALGSVAGENLTGLIPVNVLPPVPAGIIFGELSGDVLPVVPVEKVPVLTQNHIPEISAEKLTPGSILSPNIIIGSGGPTLAGMSQSVADIASASILTPAKKPDIIREYNRVMAAATTLVSQAQALSIGTTDFVSARDALRAYMSGLRPSYSDTSVNTSIDPSTFSARWSAYYSAEATLTSLVDDELSLRNTATIAAKEAADAASKAAGEEAAAALANKNAAHASAQAALESEDAAGKSAAAASTAQGKAETAQGKAIEYRDAALSSADTAAGSAATATRQAGLAASSATSALLTAANGPVLPSDFTEEGRYWSTAAQGLPTRASLVSDTSGAYSFPTVAGVGKVLQTSSTGIRPVAPLGWMPWTSGQRFRITVRHRCIEGTANIRIYRAGMTDTAMDAGSGAMLVPSTADWTTTVYDMTADVNANTAFIRPAPRVEAGSTRATVQFAFIRIEDVTSQLAAAGSADAASSSASTATTRATEARQHAETSTKQASNSAVSAGQASASAGVAERSASTATTKAGEASGSASAAASSALTAESAAGEASSSARVANDSAVLSSESRAAAETFATVAATVAQALITPNPVFANWAEAAPDGWSNWSGTPVKIDGLNSPNAVQFVTRGLGEAGIQITPTDTNGMIGVFPGHYVLECDFKLVSGDFGAMGILLDQIDPSGSSTRIPIRFDAEASLGAPVAGKTYRLRKLVQFTRASMDRLRIFMMHSYGALGNRSDKQTIWYRCGLRVASEAEIHGGKGGTLEARVTQQAGAISALEGKTSAYWQVSANAGSNSAVISARTDSATGSTIGIAANSISLSNLNGSNLQPALVIENGVATLAAKLRANSITATELAANSVTAGKIATDAVTANTIAANAVTAAKIAAGTITGDKVAAGTISASKLQVSGENLFPDPYCQDIDWWKGPSQGTFAETGRVTPVNASNAYNVGWELKPAPDKSLIGRVGGSKGFWQLWSGNSNDGYRGAETTQVIAPSIYCKPSTTYEVGIGCTNGSNRALNVYVQCFNAAGANTATVLAMTFAAGDQSTILQRAKVTTNDTAVSFRIFWETPSGTAFSGFIDVGGVTLREAAGGTMIIDGSITAGLIAANAIQTSKLDAGAVTADKIQAGAVTTEKMTANSINGDRITAGTLNASKIVAGSITTTQMTANTINGDRIAANTLNASKIIAGTITTDRMTANTINGDRIQAGTLAADKIIANSISSAQIAAGAITADKLTVGFGSNMLHGGGLNVNPNSYMACTDSRNGADFAKNGRGEWLLGSSQWTYGGEGSNPSYQLPDQSVWSLRQVNNYNPNNNTYTDNYFIRPTDANGGLAHEYDVEPGRTYEFSLYTGAHRCFARVYMIVLDQAWNHIMTVGDDANSLNDEQAGGGRDLSSFRRIFVRGTMPSNARFVRLMVRKGRTKAGHSDSYLFMAKPVFAETSPSATTLVGWSAPSQSIIDGSGIRTGTIEADRLKVGSLDAITARIGTLRTASSGQRVEISDDVIKVYDASNVLRVKLGDLSK